LLYTCGFFFLLLLSPLPLLPPHILPLLLFIKVGRPDGTAAATAPVPQASTAAAAAFPPHQQQQAFTPNHVATSAALDAALGRGPPVGVAMHMGGGGASGMLQGGKPKVHISNLDANINAEVREGRKLAPIKLCCYLTRYSLLLFCAVGVPPCNHNTFFACTPFS